MNRIIKLAAQFYSFFYFIFWGFNFSAGYLYCEKNNNSFLIEY